MLLLSGPPDIIVHNVCCCLSRVACCVWLLGEAQVSWEVQWTGALPRTYPVIFRIQLLQDDAAPAGFTEAGARWFQGKGRSNGAPVEVVHWLRSRKAAGKTRLEGKSYVVQDGDIINFRFNV